MLCPPEIVCCLSEVTYTQAITWLGRYQSFELRIDLLDWTIDQVHAFMDRAPRTILTYRESSGVDRTAFFESVDWNRVDVLDLDVTESQSFNHRWSQHAKKADCRLVYSCHSIERFRDPQEILEHYGRLFDEADYVKVAVLCEHIEHLELLSHFQSQDPQHVAIPMGEEIAEYGRKWLMNQGCPWMYGYPADHQSVAPGQVSCEELLLCRQAYETQETLMGVAGHPISHSRSPDLFSTVDRGYYFAYLRLALQGLSETLELDFLPLRMVQVTAPFKGQDLGPFGQKKHRYNNGVDLSGIRKSFFNTDTQGVLYAIEKIAEGKKVESVLVVGTGGAAWAACAALYSLYDVKVVGRSQDKGAWILSDFAGCSLRSWFEYGERVDDCDIIVWTVPSGVVGELGLQLRPRVGLLDAHYQESLEGQLGSVDFRYLDGKSWLIGQALPLLRQLGVHHQPEYFGRFFGRKPERGQRIALVGLPGSGKSTVVESLGELSGWESVDLDRLIEDKEAMKVSDIFEEKGEAYFRSCEALHLRESAECTRIILATGGGTLERPENRECLRGSFKVVWLVSHPVRCWKRTQGGDRPLLADGDSLSRMMDLHQRRWKHYADTADIAIFVDNLDTMSVAQRIYEEHRHSF